MKARAGPYGSYNKFTYGKAQIFRNACENITRLGGKLLRDFEHFAIIIRLHYVHYTAKKERHPFYVKSNWNPPEKLRMHKQNTKTTVPLDVAPERRTKRCSPRFRPGGRFCELRFRYQSSPTGIEGEISRPLDHM